MPGGRGGGELRARSGTAEVSDRSRLTKRALHCGVVVGIEERLPRRRRPLALRAWLGLGFKIRVMIYIFIYLRARAI